MTGRPAPPAAGGTAGEFQLPRSEMTVSDDPSHLRPAAPRDREHWQRVDRIFNAVIEAPAAERAARLEALCDGDAAVRTDVSRLLAGDRRAESGFLEAPAGAALAAPAPSRDAAGGRCSQERPGAVIGPYTLHERIGEGGFGVVYLAEQHRPVRRRVALKIIKPGMDTHEVVTRFQAERQTLALMDHPHIARVLDGGETASGRPYFVMELVRGIPITDYCDQCSLTMGQRLELFIPVCQAVQHAHQKGIIHRDLKPSNVLIAIQDGVPAPRIIDFGVAKALNQRLTEHTIHTQFAQLVGTPLYMSPEQAEMSPLEVDTRSDIYSLGAMLYELLTGSTPFERQRLAHASFDDLRRIIRLEEPPTPSSRLSTLGGRALDVARQRRTDPQRLHHLVRGDLDWIVMKALDKDRTRRYGTASGLAADVQRYLDDEPVEACPPSTAYRLRKFMRRHRVAAALIGVVFMILSAGITTSSYFAASASREARAAKDALAQADVQRSHAEGVNEFFTEQVFGLADPKRFDRAGISLVDALDIAAGKIHERFPDDAELRAAVHDCFGEIYGGIDKPHEAVQQLQQAVELRCSIAGAKDPSTLKSRGNLGRALFKATRLDEAQRVLGSTLMDQTAVLGAEHPETVQTAVQLSVVRMLKWQGFREQDPTQADQDLEFAWTTYQQAVTALGPRHLETLDARSAYAWMLRWRGRPAEALEHANAAAIGFRETTGVEDVRAMYAAYNYAACLKSTGRVNEAIAEFKALTDARYRVLGRAHIESLWTAWSFANALQCAGREAEATEVLDDVLAHLDEIQATKNWQRGQALFCMVGVLIALKDYDRAANLHTVACRMYADAPEDATRQDVYVRCLNDSASMLATSPHPELRNGPLAVDLATKACELTAYENPGLVETLAAAHLESGDSAAALQVVQNLRSARPNDPRLIATLANLADRFRRNGQPIEANTMLGDARTLVRESMGDEHPAVANSLHKLGDALRDSGKWSEAEETFREAVAMRRKLFGDEHPDLAHSLHGLAWMLNLNGRSAEAEALSREELAMRRQVLGGEHPDVAMTLQDLAVFLRDQGKLEEAEAAARECLGLRERTMPGDFMTFDAQSVLGGYLLEQGRFADAEPLLRSGYEGMEQRVEHTPFYCGDCLEQSVDRLIDLYEHWLTAGPDQGSPPRAVVTPHAIE